MMNEIELRFLDNPHVCSIIKRRNPFEIKMHPLKKLLLRLVVVSKKHPEHWKYFECENDILFEQRRHIHLRNWFIMHPFSIMAGLCDTFMLVIYIFDQYHVPFNVSEELTHEARNRRLVTSIFLIVNVIRQFFMGYMDKEFMVAVLDMDKIARNYFRGWFLLDAFGALPFYVPVLFNKELGSPLDDKERYLFGVMRLNKVLTVRLLYKSMVLALEFFNANATVKRIVPLAVFTMVAINWTARMLVFIPLCIHGPDLPNVNDSWVNIKPETRDRKPIDEGETKLYILCLFRSVMLILKLGFGTMYPRTAEDVLLTVLCVVLGRLALFFMIEQVLSVNKWVRSPRVRYLAQMRLVKGFLRHREVPMITRKKVEMYFERQLGGTYFRESALLSLLSASLREELRDHELRLLIRDSDVLRRLPPGLGARVARCLKREIFLPNDVVVRIGSFGDCMYLLAAGTVCVVLRNGFELSHIEDGGFFGEIEILTSMDRRMASVIAVERWFRRRRRRCVSQSGMKAAVLRVVEALPFESFCRPHWAQALSLPTPALASSPSPSARSPGRTFAEEESSALNASFVCSK